MIKYKKQMNKHIYVLVSLLLISVFSFSQKKSSEHKLKDIEGVAIGGKSQSQIQVVQSAINDAKVNALKKAGIEENINAYSEYYKNESENTFEELFTSDVLSNINGTVKNVEVVDKKMSFTPEGQMKCDIKINCTVVKYKTKKDKALIIEALTHKSYKQPYDNERLEFLGDAVLELVVTDFLYKKFPKVKEGILTAYRSSLVRTESISAAAREMGMNDLLMLSKGESRDIGKARDYILANAFESFVGAIYLDGGYDEAKKIIAGALFDNIDFVIETGSWKDSKSHVQELAQEHYSETPRYELVSAVGPDHDKHFVMAIYFGDKKIAEGAGNSKQKSQQDAAFNALSTEGWEKES